MRSKYLYPKITCEDKEKEFKKCGFSHIPSGHCWGCDFYKFELVENLVKEGKTDAI